MLRCLGAFKRVLVGVLSTNIRGSYQARLFHVDGQPVLIFFSPSLSFFLFFFLDDRTSRAGRKGPRRRIRLRKLFEEIRTQTPTICKGERKREAIKEGKRKGKWERRRRIWWLWWCGLWWTRSRPSSFRIPLESEADHNRYRMVSPSPRCIESPD